MLEKNTQKIPTSRVENYNYRGHQYWITIERVKHDSTGETAYLAYKSYEEPGWLNNGSPVKDLNGDVIIAKEELIAFTLANTVIEAEIDSLTK